jgi:predicted NAD/FAD-binding protein
MRVGVIGGGVAGMGAAWALRDTCDVTLFEADTRLGGHAHTVTINYDGAKIDVDTGFIVYNDDNYPNLISLLGALDVETIASDMSFAVSDPDGFEWSSNGMSGIFAWKRNLANPRFLSMLGDIVKFSTAARADLAREGELDAMTLEDYVMHLKLGRSFMEHYLLPMGAAIWSTPERDMLGYPALSFLRFFDNHRLLHAKRPLWRTIAGGSRTYVNKIAASLGPRLKLGAAAVKVRRVGAKMEVSFQNGAFDTFDHVILACHSDQALGMLDDSASDARAQLSAIRYAPNTAYLHRDLALMPKRRAAWASWNYLRNAGLKEGDVCVSYWMNLLQSIDHQRPLFVTLNPRQKPDPSLTFGTYSYDHPQFDRAALAAQRALQQRQGEQGLSFAGAWLGYGFHEDGLASGLSAAVRLGAQLPWKVAHRRLAPTLTDLAQKGALAEAA